MKKNSSTIFCVFILLLINATFGFAQNKQEQKSKPARTAVSVFPTSIEGKVQSFYRHRKDGKPGREVMLYFNGGKFMGKGTLEMECSGEKETVPLDVQEGIDSLSVLLPAGAGVKSDCEATFVLKSKGKEVMKTMAVPALRQWTVYIYPHSHVDIGYTNTHVNVEVIHRRNLINGIELAKKTANYPEGARYLWNPEVLWPVERYFKKATPEQKQYIIDAVKKGYLHLDAGYVHTNTSAAADEELFEFIEYSKDFEKLTGKKIETFVQVDVPGMSWGLVPVLAKSGVKYIFTLNNGDNRTGHSMELSFKPFWWKSIDGQSKVLFLQPGSYTPGAQPEKGLKIAFEILGQTDTTKIPSVVKTDNPRKYFVDKYLAQKLPELEKSDYYPYDIFAMSWSMADNTPIDADLPDAVKSWNEEYAYPHLVISSATGIMQAFEEKYGDQLPVRSGDFTEYWTDGLGTAAKQTGMNRRSKERLIQDETLWTMLHPGEAAPRAEMKEAWRNIIMGTEHTWCYFDPSKQPITNDILKVKFGFFQQAEDASKSLMDAALSTVTKNESSIIGVFNTLSWKRSGLIRLSAQQSEKQNSVQDDKGNNIVSQRLSTGELVFFAEDIPALGSKNYFLKNKGKRAVAGNLVKENILDNGIVKAVIDPQTGDISSLICGSDEFVDTILNNYRYLHGGDTPEKATGASNVKISIKENGPLVASILVESQAEGCNGLTREITIIAGQPLIEIKNIVDKKAVSEKEGIHFGFAFDVKNPIIRADIPWGIMTIDDDQLAEGNRNWICFQRWLDISNSEKGVTWCSLDAPVFEVGDMTANVIGSATNSPEWIRKIEPSATIYSWALNNHWYTNFPLSQEGVIPFRYRILPHNGKFDAAAANRFGMEQAQPLIVSTVPSDFKVENNFSFQSNPSVSLSVLKTVDDGKAEIIRLRSVSTSDETVTLTWNTKKPKKVLMCDEDNGSTEAGNRVVVPAMGFITLKVIW